MGRDSVGENREQRYKFKGDRELQRVLIWKAA